MNEPRTLGELLAELDRRSVLQPGAEGFLGNAAMTHTYGNAASYLRNILHGTDEAPGLVERVRENIEGVQGFDLDTGARTVLRAGLTAEISTDGRETT